ncbi:MAG: HAD family hydrolase, partial [Nitrososphaera sp.]|nr:HAD family hydrolase [Nitrososphaera sp.]
PKFEGLPTKNKLLILSNKGLVAHDSHAAIATRKQEITHDLLKRNILYSAPLVHMMKRLENHGIQVSIVTNCTEKSAWIMMKNLGIQRYIRTIVTSEDVEHPKPDPEGLNLAMWIMGVKPEEVIYIGDQPVDAKAANAAGIKNYVHVDSVNKVCWELLRCRVA